MKIYTKTGDSGTTGLFGGDRVSKSHPRLDAYGTVDELNSVLGYCVAIAGEAGLAEEDRDWTKHLLEDVQHNLFVIGAQLATPLESKPSIPKIADSDVRHLETAIDEMESVLPPLKSFILPGGVQTAAVVHTARTICRRAERETIKLGEAVEIDARIPIYLNRLSDLLFVLARWTNNKLGKADVEWHPERRVAGGGE